MNINWSLAAASLAFIAIVSIVSGYLGGRRYSRANYAGPVQDFVLASKGLQKQSLIQLLLSSSFSLNGMLYQIWLGYTIGIYALGVQLIWALSYVWLSKYVGGIRGYSSLHAFLGDRFGPRTRVLAALCSIAGFAVLVGWELNVGRSTFSGLLNLPTASELVIVFMVATAFVCVIYTAMGGLGGDAFANTLQNIVKISVFCLMAFLLYLSLTSVDNSSFRDRLFPDYSVAITALGVFGLVTNIAFSAVWQFVDMSTWQSVIASKRSLADDQAKSALRFGGIAVFIAPGIIGTLLGALMAGAKDVTSDNVMTKLVGLLPGDPIFIFAVLVALLATIMSMLDGVLLAAAYSIVCDIIYRRTTLETLDSDPVKANRALSLLRIALAVVAVIGGLGVTYLVERGISLFNVTYILIIGQLSLVGPVFFGLRNYQSDDRMLSAILVALIVGVGAVSGGIVLRQEWLLTGAGLFTMVVSYLIAASISQPPLPEKKTK